MQRPNPALARSRHRWKARCWRSCCTTTRRARRDGSRATAPGGRAPVRGPRRRSMIRPRHVRSRALRLGPSGTGGSRRFPTRRTPRAPGRVHPVLCERPGGSGCGLRPAFTPDFTISFTPFFVFIRVTSARHSCNRRTATVNLRDSPRIRRAHTGIVQRVHVPRAREGRPMHFLVDPGVVASREQISSMRPP